MTENTQGPISTRAFREGALKTLQTRAEAAESALATTKSMWSEERDARANAEADLAAAIAALRGLKNAKPEEWLPSEGHPLAAAWRECERVVADYDAKHAKPTKTREEKLRDVYGPEAFDAAEWPLWDGGL